MNSAADAFARAAKHAPLFKPFRLYGRAEIERLHQQAEIVFDWQADARGALRWKAFEKFLHPADPTFAMGDGVLTLYADLPTIPDAVLCEDGAWLLVDAGLERDGLGAGLRLAVRRWTEPNLPTIRAGAP